MTLRLVATTASEITHRIAAERHRLGAHGAGMALTLVIITDEHNQSEATRAAAYSAGQHPCRILVVIPRPGKAKPQLDAEIDIGASDGPGETVTLRLIGPLANHQASVVLPLLLADTPVVAWWPSKAPTAVASDPVGALAQRRITDAAATRQPIASLAQRAQTYSPGDTDLAWTRITGWRSALAATLDEPYSKIKSVQVGCQQANPSGELLAAWLRARLSVRVSLLRTRGPDVTSVELGTANGPITLARTDAQMASLSRPNSPTRKLPMPRHERRELLAEELRRLDSDEIYAQALEHLNTRPSKGKVNP